MKKQIKESIDELYKEQLCQQKSIKIKKHPKKLPILFTLFVTATVVLFAVFQLQKAPNFQNEEAISNGNYKDTTITQEATQSVKEETSTVNKNGTVTFYHENDIQFLKKEFQRAEQIPGIANISSPQYKVRLGEDGELFFLWFNGDQSATLMESKDTHTIYKINSAEKIEEMLQETKALEQFMADIKWETGMVSMVKPFDMTFASGSTRYQLWLNEEQRTITLVPVENNANRWTSLNEKDSATLMTFLEKNDH